MLPDVRVSDNSGEEWGPDSLGQAPLIVALDHQVSEVKGGDEALRTLAAGCHNKVYGELIGEALGSS